ncbi:hypothetical protein OG21DRAFT_1424309 [Imleria badia]|nr:hypothetical protein OG21DRAFT_1424309 [Imleria badia]
MVQTFETTWPILLQRMERFNKFVDGIAQIHPYTSLAWSVISAANKVLVEQKKRDDQIVRLAGVMNDVFSFVEDTKPLQTIERSLNTITLLMKQVAECGYFITAYAKDNFLIRTAKYTISDIDARITDYVNNFRDLKAALMEGTALQTGFTVLRMMNVVEQTAESIDLDDLPYARGARFEREKGCLPGTRKTFLTEICDILNNCDEDAPRVCLLTGVAGSGKSAVAHTIAQLYDGLQRLGSSYCFASTDVTNRNPKNLFSTIARDLCKHDPQYRSALRQVVKDDRSLRTSQSPLDQFERLIVDPYKDLHGIGPLVIVIDALDESGDQTSRGDLLRTIFAQITKNALPTHLRFLITARPEADILAELLPCPQIACKQMGDIPEGIVDEDIRTFVHYSLDRYTELGSNWPGEKWCQLLVDQSHHLFQWTSTACNFIRGDGAGAGGLSLSERFDIVVQADDSKGVQPLDKLDQLYRTILAQHFTSDFTRHRFREVMAVLLDLKEPLSITSLSALFVGCLSVREIIKPLGSLLDGVLDEEKPIRPLHISFHDFLHNEARSSVFHVPIQSRHSLRLGQALLACMRNMLQFNICNLKDSRIRNTAIPDLPSQVNKAIPPHLAYSCQYWMDHLQHAECNPALLDEVTVFFKDFFPYWLEAISLLSLFSPVSSILSAVGTCTTLNKWAQVR